MSMTSWSRTEPPGSMQAVTPAAAKIAGQPRPGLSVGLLDALTLRETARFESADGNRGTEAFLSNYVQLPGNQLGFQVSGYDASRPFVIDPSMDYGTLLGGLLGSLGLITGGLLGYGLMLTSARRLVQRFTGPESIRRMESLFDRCGAWAIILTRSLPYSVPEAMVFLAGLAGMPMPKFTAALTAGSVPTAFAFAAIGAGWADQPIVALAVSYVLPILLLPIALYLMRLRAR